MEIERLWGLGVGGFRATPRPERVRLFGWYRVHMDPGGADG